ncbi:formimidoylglutamase [Peribacillus glennii]|uniref:Formimidoylglutamase n=1 Tax=Peribacillus glennii TaxID=2303991 RepID=A0A372LF19_9BACI|nr:formimidoylglutamase [Peribacillus glennii]RFU64901.1 formimidoylglutamase [Peribacillus glennii]
MDKFSYLLPANAAGFKDRYVTKVTECISHYSTGIRGEIGLIGLPFSKSSISHSQAGEAPNTIRDCLSNITTYSGEWKMDFKDKMIVDFGNVAIHPINTEESLSRIYTSIKEIIDSKSCERYIMLGGDHGVSFPSIRAFQEKFGTIGVLQWDAHHDVRNLKDGGRTNGTPFRSLLEGRFVNGEHLVQIGIRDFSNSQEYHGYTKEKGITVYNMADVEQEGIVPLVKQEVERLSKEVDFIYLSVDMDVVDQAFAPGCPAIGPGGVTSRELLGSVAEAAKHKKVKALDIVEIDPSRDFRDMTSRLAAHVMLRFMYIK